MQISAQLASLSITNSLVNSTAPKFSPTPFSAPRSFVRINTLWSCSLTISLITASIGILVKQWFHEFMAQDTQDPQFRIRIRFFRNEGLDKWKVFQIAAALPLLLQVALLLFFTGLSEYLRELNPVVGWATTGIILVWLALFIFTTLAPILSSQCPYRTPILKQPLRYMRSTTQPIYGVIKRYMLWGVWLFASSSLGTRVLTSQILLPRKKFRGVWIFVIRQAKMCFFSLHEGASWVLSRFESLVMGNGGIGFWFRFISTAPISLPLMLTFLAIHICKEMYRVVRRKWPDTSCWKWPDTSRWQYIPPPEEGAVRDDERNDQEILIYSGPFFLDQQLNQTIRECIKPIAASQIVSEFAVGRPASSATPGWEVNLGLGTKRGTHDMVRGIFLHMAVSEPTDSTWFAALEYIIQSGIGGPYWSDLPTLMIQLTRSDLEHGAMSVFLALYSSLAQSGGSMVALGKIFEESQTQGDQQCA